MKKERLYECIELNKDNTVGVPLPLLNPKKCIFWVGSGVSHDSPSDLPTGNGLTDAFLKAMLGEEKYVDFVLFWNNRITPLKSAVLDGKWERIKDSQVPYIRDSFKDAYDRPRLEYVIGEMHKLDEEFGDFRFCKDDNNRRFSRRSSIRTLSHFSEAEPNINHRYIAEFVKAGAEIITSNFDVCIEKALEIGFDVLQEPEYDVGIPAIKYGAEKYVYHFHGIATDSNIEKNLGATINNISKPVPDGFRIKLQKWLGEGYDIVFIGYSGSDYFDIRPLFEELLENGPFPGRAIYIDHCRDDKEIEDHKARRRGYQYLINPLCKQYICYGLTEDILKSLLEDAGFVLPVSVETLAKGVAFDATEDELMGMSEGREDYYFINMFRLCAELNINPGFFYPDWGSKINEIYNAWREDAADTIKKLLTNKKRFNDCVIEDIRFNNWNSRNSDYLSASKGVRNVYKKLKIHENKGKIRVSERTLKQYVDRTCHILKYGFNGEDDEEVQRKTMMYLYSRWIKICFILAERFPVLRKVCVWRLKKWLPYYDVLLEYNAGRFMYRTHYLFPTRFRNLIHALAGDVEPDSLTGLYGDIQHEWDICMETPDFFDARETIRNRLEQIKYMGLRGVIFDRDIIEDLDSIFNEIDSLRSDP